MSPQEGPRFALRMLRTLRARLVLAAAAVAAGVAAFLVYPRWPAVPETIEPARAETTGRLVLGEVLAAHGGMAAFRAVGAVEAHLDDRWNPLLSSFSVWPGTARSGRSARIDAAFSARNEGYRARFSFADQTLWGFDGRAAWVYQHGAVQAESPAIYRARDAAWMTSRLLFLPFSIVHEQAEVRALDRDVLEIRFPRPFHKKQTDRWRVHLDTTTRRIETVVFEGAAPESSPVESCSVLDREEVKGMLLPGRLKCYTTGRLAIDLHEITFEAYRAEDSVADRTFEPPALKASIGEAENR